MVTKDENKILWVMFGVAFLMLIIGLLPMIQVAMTSQQSGSETKNVTEQPTPAPSIPLTKTPLKLYTAQDVAKHNKPSDCWVMIKGYVYDITELVSQVASAQQLQIQTQLARSCGQDATAIFDQAMQSPEFSMVKSSVDGYLQQMAIGKIK